MGLLFAAYILLLITLIYALFNLLRGLQPAQVVLAVFLFITADTILVMEISGLLTVLNQPVALVLIQLVLTILGLIINQIFRISYPRLTLAGFRQYLQVFLSKIWHNKLLFVFLLVVIAVYIFQLTLTTRFPQNVSDVLYNHLSRIGFWLQQGSLKHYNGFSQIGMFYPYNNSLLMTLPIVFLKSDRYVGLVQYSAAIMTAISIYLTGAQLGFNRKGSLVAALIFLTYPIILFESITAQNDLLAACFTLISFLFLITSFSDGRRVFLVLSALSLALAIGTNQYVAFILPGYLALLLYYSISKKRLSVLKLWSAAVVSFTLLLGCYSYIQNIVYYHNPIGPGSYIKDVTKYEGAAKLAARVGTNASRLFAQFISCDGLIPAWERECLRARARVLAPLLPKNIESSDFLYDTERFSLTRAYSLSAETSWFGLISWLMILPAVVITTIHAIRKKKIVLLIVLFGALLFFLGISVIKHGWDPYQGRYLIVAIALTQPLTAILFGSKKVAARLLRIIVCAAAIFIMIYSAANNLYLPILNRRDAEKLYMKAQTSSVHVQITARLLLDASRYEVGVNDLSPVEIMTMAERAYYQKPVEMVEEFVPKESSLGIAVERKMFYDYLFRGDDVKRILTPLIKNGSAVQSFDDFILVAPNEEYALTDPYRQIVESNGWRLFEKMD